MFTHSAIIDNAFTAVKRVISFFSRSRNIGKHVASSGPRASPILHIIWALSNNSKDCKWQRNRLQIICSKSKVYTM